MSNQIEVWNDETSDADESVWCVSMCDDDGEEIACLSTHDDNADAVDAGRKAAQERGLRLCERSKHGPITEIASASTIQMESLLLSHGVRFSGNNVEDEAAGWDEQGFDADTAGEWCEIGVWEAAVAAKFRDAGLTPSQVVSAADSLTDGLDDPAEEYTDGCPIYAACNGDTDAQEIIDAAKAE